jgi:CRP-like cAMP-binding protein
MSSSDLISIIRTVICRTLTPEQATELSAAMLPVAVAEGDVVFREGDASTGLFVLLRGQAEVSKTTPDGTARAIATITAPTVIGEMGLITSRPRSATVRALSDCELHQLTPTQFDRMITAERMAAYKLVATIAEVLARRVETMDEKLMGLEEPSGTPPPVADLAALREKLFTEWTF